MVLSSGHERWTPVKGPSIQGRQAAGSRKQGVGGSQLSGERAWTQDALCMGKAPVLFDPCLPVLCPATVTVSSCLPPIHRSWLE